MLLALDIGNTNIKSALFEDSRIVEFLIHSNIEKAISFITQTNFTITAICSVNPLVHKTLFDIIKSKGVSVFNADIQKKLNLEISYKTPTTLGVDRICSAVGALEIATSGKIISEKQFLITIDFGTATTINVVSPDRKFIGGSIAPGIHTMLNSLTENTAQLPLTEVQLFEGIIGNSTNTSILSGVMRATIGMINEIINELKKDSNQLPIIFVTGGNSRFILPHLKHKVLYEEALVLKGLKFIYDWNN